MQAANHMFPGSTMLHVIHGRLRDLGDERVSWGEVFTYGIGT